MALSKYFDSIILDWENSFNCRAIDQAIKALEGRHKTHIKRYGKGNERRLTGRHETASVSFNEHNRSLT